MSAEVIRNTYRRQGAQAERERIIKLLEELDDEEWMGINQNFIALIKGENSKREAIRELKRFSREIGEVD